MKIYLRKYKYSDSHKLYEWRFKDPSVIENSVTNTITAYENHCLWLKSFLIDENSHGYIMICNDNLVGQVRFTIEENVATISYSIDNQYRRLGYGKKIIMLAEDVIRDQYTDMTIRAIVKNTNVASLRIFELCNYEKEEGIEYTIFNKKVFSR